MKWVGIFILSIAAFCNLSCLHFTDEIDYVTFRSPVLSITVKSIVNTRVEFNAKASWPDGCGRFSHFTTDRSGDSTYYITVYGKEHAGATCTQAFIEFNAPIDIDVRRSGRYTFHFWISDSTSKDTTFNIP